MLNRWLLLDLPMKIIWVTAILSSIVFVLQIFYAFSKLSWKVEPYDDFEDVSENERNPLKRFDFRSLVGFLFGASWTCIALQPTSITMGWLILAALIAGFAVISVSAYGGMYIKSYNQSRKIPTSATVGCVGFVFLSIPAKRQGVGMVQITIKNTILNFDAQTDGDAIDEGTSVQVLKIVSKNTLLVEPVRL